MHTNLITLLNCGQRSCEKTGDTLRTLNEPSMTLGTMLTVFLNSQVNSLHVRLPTWLLQ